MYSPDGSVPIKVREVLRGTEFVGRKEGGGGRSREAEAAAVLELEEAWKEGMGEVGRSLEEGGGSWKEVRWKEGASSTRMRKEHRQLE